MKRARIILEMGTGNDLHGSDYTKAALRAVQDALHHSSLSLFKSLNLSGNDMKIDLTIGVQEPAKVDLDKVAGSLPFGTVKPVARLGGANLPADGPHDQIVVATAAIEVWFDIPDALVQSAD
ncbi:MAG: Lin0512 family protein [Burkholderiaceae bacterium]